MKYDGKWFGDHLGSYSLSAFKKEVDSTFNGDPNKAKKVAELFALFQLQKRMATILGLLRKFENLDASGIAVESMVETAENIETLNAEQMHKGLNAEGEKIGEYRSELYAEQKNRMNPLPGFGYADLRLTGAFYEGLYVHIDGDKIQEGSTDEKEEKLEEKYGKVIFGLSALFRREYVNEFLQPVFRRKMEEATGLKFGRS